MKRLIPMAGLAALLLFATWLLTEKEVWKKQDAVEGSLRAALADLRSVELPHVRFAPRDGVWRTSSGQMVRAEALQEFQRSLEAFHFARVLDPSEGGGSREDFFGEGVNFKLNGTTFTLGDLAPSGDVFYFGMEGEPGVRVVDLREMGSLATADTENVLQEAKYQRLRDLFLANEHAWRETRLTLLTRLGSFRSWTDGERRLDAPALGARPWAEPLLKAFQAGLLSLHRQGEELAHKPAGKPALASWRFLEGKEETVWEFYAHPSLPLLYVWVASLGRAFPVDEPSSALLRRFPARLIDKPSNLTLRPQPPTHARLVQGRDSWEAEVVAGRWTFRPSSLDEEKAVGLLNFFSAPQTFAHVSLLAPTECRTLAAGAKFAVTLGAETWHWLSVPGGHALLECGLNVALGFFPPLDSGFDFVSLKKP